MMEINLKALAKINLGLDVLSRREDGYHQVRMIMQSIYLYDRIILTRTKDTEIKVETNLYFLPANENNLVYQAAKLLKDEFKINDGVYINLKKHIPVSAGLGGGSSDAAAILFGMNKMFALGLTLNELMIRGARIGADVPFCLMRGTVLAEGIGEELTPLSHMTKCPIVIVKPNVSVSTKTVYENLTLNEHTKHPDINGIIKNIEEKNLKGIACKMGNVLESVTIREYPIINDIKEELMNLGALNAMMSGSGPTVFALFDHTQTARNAYAILREKDIAKQIYLTEIYNTKR